MIDCPQRRKLAVALRRLASARITCDEFDAASPPRTNDPAVKAVADYGWSLYSEWDDRLTGRKALSPEERRRVARCVLFLHTEHPYRWPPTPRWGVLGPLYILTAGRFGFAAASRRRWSKGIDWDVWPFGDRRSLRAVAASWPVARAV